VPQMDTMRTGMGAEAITADLVGAIAPSSDLTGSEREVRGWESQKLNMGA
jgi:hypothetical protein